MDLYEFLNTFVSAVAADSTLAAWAVDNLGAAPQIYVGLENDDFPEPNATSGPVVIFGMPERSNNQARREVEYAFELWLSLYKTGTKSRADGVNEPAGVELVNDLLELVKTTIKTAAPDLFDLGFENDALFGQGPEFDAVYQVSFTAPVLIGQDPLA
jgi:hypothetical protein